MKVSSPTTASSLKNELILFMLLLVGGLTMVSCKKDKEDEPEASKMRLSATLEGKAWQANGFLVQKATGTAMHDAHLLIQSRSSRGAITMYLQLYRADKPGTYTANNKQNPRQEDAALEITGSPEGFSPFFGWGPATYRVTRVEGKHYSGTFTASFFDITRNKTIEVSDGRFEVREGIQAEE